MHCPCIREIPKVEEAWALESGIQLKDSGILQETESSIDKESRIQCVDSVIHSAESTIQDCLGRPYVG